MFLLLIATHYKISTWSQTDVDLDLYGCIQLGL